jgi:hypothetical protein
LLFGAVNRKLTIRDYYLDPGDDERADLGAGLKSAEERRFEKSNRKACKNRPKHWFNSPAGAEIFGELF